MLRISPQAQHTFRIVEMFAAAVRGEDPGNLVRELGPLLPLGPCNGYLAGKPGMDHVVTDAA